LIRVTPAKSASCFVFGFGFRFSLHPITRWPDHPIPFCLQMVEATKRPATMNFASPVAMKCPFCGFINDKVVDSRESKEGELIRRRRECMKCEKRFTTYERIDEIPYMVVKKDGRREKFERQKILSGLLRACEKRPISMGRLEQIVNEVETFVIDSPDRERTTSEIGELIMDHLKQQDTVAYIRFASVYRDFKDVREFGAELEHLMSKEAKTAKAKPSSKHQ
jgi:transcriptional repressor NrdR